MPRVPSVAVSNALPDPPTDDAIASAIGGLLGRRAGDATVCPSEVARSLAGDGGGAWRALMPRIRQVAGRLAAEGRLRVTRGGVDVDATAGGGPIRLGRLPGTGGGSMVLLVHDRKDLVSPAQHQASTSIRP